MVAQDFLELALGLGLGLAAAPAHDALAGALGFQRQRLFAWPLRAGLASSPAMSAPSSTLPWWRQLTGYHWFVFIVAALGWLALFGAWYAKFAPIYLKPRPDGRSG